MKDVLADPSSRSNYSGSHSLKSPVKLNSLPLAELPITLSQFSSQELADFYASLHIMAQCIVAQNKVKTSFLELETSTIILRATEMALETERVKKGSKLIF